MKVMCIEEPPFRTITLQGERPPKSNEIIHVGKIYTVVAEGRFITGELCYGLQEKDPDTGFLIKYFAPLSSIDETELIKERLQEA